VAKFKCFGTTVTNQNSIHKEIKSRLNLGNACHHSIQNLLSSCLPSKNLKIKIYKTVILFTVVYGCETWSLTQREEHRLRVFWEQGAKESVCTWEGGSGRRLGKAA